MQKRPMFPYRRPGQKKRNRNVPGGRKPHEAGRRLPGSARELLPLMQPTTKALAQMLSGKAQASGQLAHARNVLAQAQRLVDERQIDRLMPADREEFFEQVARLRLTIADAEAEAEAAEAEPEEQAPAAPPVDRARLREMALALSRPAPERAQAPAEPAVATAEEIAAEKSDDEGPTPPPGWLPARPSTRSGSRLRLRMRTEEEDEAPAAAGDGSGAAKVEGLRSGRLRLRRPATRVETAASEDEDEGDDRAAS